MDNYAEVIESVKDQYDNRIREFLKNIQHTIHLDNWNFGDIVLMDGDNYEWFFSATKGFESVWFTLSIQEAVDYGDDFEYGINFDLNFVRESGEILGQMTPYNYTEDCWVDARDFEAVEARWQLFEQADLSEIPALMSKPERVS